MGNCVICNGESAGKLVQCKDAESWARLYWAAEIRQFEPGAGFMKLLITF